jgi:hypothetical protein
MAGTDVIEAAIGITLLLIVSYVVIGSITGAANTVSSAQNDLTQRQQEQLGTSINISDKLISGSSPNYILKVNITNTGSQTIGNFNNTDMFITNSYLNGNVTQRYIYIGVPNTQGDVSSHTWGYMTITPDQIHPNMLDPGETMMVQIFIGNFDKTTIINIIATTPNGVSAAVQL